MSHADLSSFSFGFRHGQRNSAPEFSRLLNLVNISAVLYTDNALMISLHENIVRLQSKDRKSGLKFRLRVVQS
jgi:hypothetical protein